ncbi:MAG: hypothetical protein AB4041_19330 [Microcystaceae cyanobacterium]
MQGQQREKIGLPPVGELSRTTASLNWSVSSKTYAVLSDLWVLNGNIENLSRLVEQGISISDVEKIPR